MNLITSTKAYCLVAALVAGSLAAGCAGARQADDAAAPGTAGPDTAQAPAAAQERAAPTSVATPAASTPATAAAGGLPPMIVHKSASCGCCGLWITHMRDAGFEIEIRDSEQLLPLKQQVGVPSDKRSCHTAQVGGYFVEGHVPAADVKRLLTERPDARGLALPGMPMGSPGMEMPDGSSQPYTVELIGNDGASTEFARH